MKIGVTKLWRDFGERKKKHLALQDGSYTEVVGESTIFAQVLETVYFHKTKPTLLKRFVTNLSYLGSGV